jgi:hypothetical protein
VSAPRVLLVDLNNFARYPSVVGRADLEFRDRIGIARNPLIRRIRKSYATRFASKLCEERSKKCPQHFARELRVIGAAIPKGGGGG